MRITEAISRNKSADAQKWYETKVKALALILANHAKDEILCMDKEPVLAERQELEVSVR